MDKHISNYLYAMKAVAVFTIIFAHCSPKNQYIAGLYASIGSIGVPIFLLVSGFLYNRNKYSAEQFWRKKVSGLVLPWFFCGMVVYMYIVLRKGGIGIVSAFNFVIGNGSFLYYMSVLMIIYLLMEFIRYRFIGYVVVMCLWGISVTFNHYNISPIAHLYLNPFNWMGWFIIGYIIKEKGYIDFIIKFVDRFKYIIATIDIVMLACVVLFELRVGYWSVWYVPCEVINIFGALAFVSMGLNNNKFVIDIGKKSFSIYLLHMPIIGIVKTFIEYDWIHAPIVLLLTWGMVTLYKVISEKIHMPWLNNLIGIRDIRAK